MGLLEKIFSNNKKPEGFLGKLMVGGMNRSLAPLADWGFSHITLKGDETALDCGCGGGANVKRLLEMAPRGKVYGLDYSEVSVTKSTKLNKPFIIDGRCEIARGDVSNPPYADDTFDLVTAFETVHYWKDAEKCFKRIYRLLKDGGRFLIVNEGDGTHEKTLKWTKIIKGMTVYTGEELEKMLKNTGFGTVTVDRDEENDRLTVLAVKD